MCGRLHRRVWDYRWPSSRKDCRGTGWPSEQVWRRLTPLWRYLELHREMGQQSAAGASIWNDCAHHFLRHHGSRRGQEEEYGREDPGVLLLRTNKHRFVHSLLSILASLRCLRRAGRGKKIVACALMTPFDLMQLSLLRRFLFLLGSWRDVTCSNSVRQWKLGILQT